MSGVLGLEKAGVDFVAADMPNANRLTVGIMAMVADEERRMISNRTKEALAAAKRRCVKLGGYRKGAKVPREAREKGNATMARNANERAALRAAGAGSLQAIAKSLNDRGIPTNRGGSWFKTQVARVLARIDSE